jgi:hypothetical protein
MSELKEKKEDVRLSYSSLKTLQSCEQKFWHYKIGKTDKDPDHEESDALSVGKAFHQVLEKTKHKAVLGSDVEEALMEHNVPKINRCLVYAMAHQAMKLNIASGLEIVHCELEISHQDYVGYIDAIGKEPDGHWWIIDLKSASIHDRKILPRLPLDIQLNLYSYFKDHIAGVLGLDPEKFAGCKYRQITKSKAQQKDGETDEQFIKRLITPAKSRFSDDIKAPIEVYDMTVPYSKMNPKMAWDIIQENLIRAKQLQAGEAPKRNYAACLDYFRPCEYFSKCHGVTFSEGHNNVKVHTIETYNNGDVL